MGRCQKKKITRKKFAPEEDEELIKLVSIYGDNWTKISEEMLQKNSQKYNRTPRQCKERYLNYLSPNINNSEWSAEEDQLLMLNSLFLLCRWKEMKQLFPGRSEVALRNRFNYLHRNVMSYIKPNLASHISTITLSQQNGVIAIEEPSKPAQNSKKTKQNKIDLDLNQSYMNSVKYSVLNIVNENCHTPQVQQNIPDQQNQQNPTPIATNNNDNLGLNNKKKRNKNVPIPQQWLDAAETIIKATKTDEVKNSIQELREKVQSLNGIIESRAFFSDQNRYSNLFNVQSEIELIDDPSFLDMFE